MESVKECPGTLLERVQNARSYARTNKNTRNANVLGVVIADATRATKTPTDAAVIKVVQGLIASNRETMNLLPAGSIEVEQLAVENTFLDKFLPERLTGDELRAIVEARLKEIDSPTIRDMGKVIGYVNTLGKLVDGAEVKSIVTQFIGA